MGRLARRRRPVVVADAAARAARPLRLALQVALGVRRLARPAGRAARAGVARPRSSTSASARRAGSRTGRASPGAARSPTRCASSASGARCAAYAAERGVRLIGDVPIYVAPARPTTARTPSCSATTPSPGTPPDAYTRRASCGATRSTTGRRCGGAATAGGSRGWRARSRSSTSRGSTTSAASSPTGRCRRARGTRSAGAGGAGRAARCSTPRARALGELPLIAEDLGVITPAVDAAARPRSGCRAWSCSSSASTPATRRASTTVANHHRGPDRLHRHARQRHAARLVRVAAGAAARALVDAARPRRRSGGRGGT